MAGSLPPDLALPPALARVKDLLAEREEVVSEWVEADERVAAARMERDHHQNRLAEIDALLSELAPPKGTDSSDGTLVKDRVRAWFEDNPDASPHVKDVAAIMGKKPNAVRSTLQRLKDKGVLWQPRPGHYQLVTEETDS